MFCLFCCGNIARHVRRSVFNNNLRTNEIPNFTYRQIFSKPKRRMSGDWFEIGRFSVFPWSISGVETCVVVKSENLHLTFDIGYTCRQSISSKVVCISHGHMDHVSGLPQHVAKRSLTGAKPATYYVPEHIAKDLSSICQLYSKIAGNVPELEKVNILPAPIGEPINLAHNFYIKPFQTTHRVESQGYILYRRENKLKVEYRDKSAPEIGQLIKEGVKVKEQVDIPELAYTGDTTFEVFQNSPPDDLFKVKLLITEATYIDQEKGKDVVQKARDRGHLHVQEIVDNAELFKDVEKIMLIHFSDKYSPKYIRNTVDQLLPVSLKDKVILSTIAKEKY